MLRVVCGFNVFNLGVLRLNGMLLTYLGHP